MSLDKQIAKNRSTIIQKIRDFFVNENFLEVETPIMTNIPGMEPHLTPFETTFSDYQSSTTPSQKFYLNTSPEIQMKKLLGAEFGNIFNITKVFRNGESGGPLHNPEFTMLEWYRPNADYKTLMDDCEKLITTLIPSQNHNLIYQAKNIDLSTPWLRLSTRELFLKYCQIDLLSNQDFNTFKKSADAKNLDTNGCRDWDDIFFKIFLNNIEPEIAKLTQPVFIYDYPATQAALAKKSATNPFFAERFELYISGIELSNAFSELIDPNEQRSRLTEEQNLRKQLGKTVFPIDEEFLEALAKIKTPCAGIALGLDRLIMILLDKKSIEEIVLFPMSGMLNSFAKTDSER